MKNKDKQRKTIKCEKILIFFKFDLQTSFQEL